ncbi:MAG: threonylcarbamoyl-AMP synthase [Burkholderiales bacterium]|nr:threonylcarbamoyl-AMP synthase [Burkholderiales bacterium]MCE7876364.1 threonylcarbamoyl-AMP synthase [Betaproteobacteria bacterium PRO3]
MSQRYAIHPTHPQPRLVRQAAAALRAGGVVVYPTDSCYALGCALDAFDAAARIRAIRGIDERHHLTLVCRDLAQAGRYARLDNWQFRLVRQGVPGAYTFLLPATRDVPRRVRHPRRSTIGMRVPAHPVAAALVAELGEPLLSSSLVLAGADAPLNDADEIVAAVGGRIDAFVDAGPCAGEPSTIVDLASPPGTVVRRGRGDPAALGLV